MTSVHDHELAHLLDPELLPFKERGASFDIWDDIPAGRKLIELALAEMLAPYPMLSDVPFEDIELDGSGNPDGLNVRLYRPVNCESSTPVMLWLHGGGYIMGSLEMDVGFLQNLAHAAACVIVSVDYRLAPEHPFPCALDDAYHALRWLHKNAVQLDIDSQRIAISGISGGGGLAAGLGLYARDKGEVPVAFQLLLCPMIDDRNGTPSSLLPLTGIGWDRHSNINAWAAYLNREPESDPMTSEVSEYAAAARADDVVGLPPSFISVGSVDLFRDENIDYARKLLEAGVPTNLHVYAGGFHAFECIAAGTALAENSLNHIQEFIKKSFKI
jgi:acetyl esterase/lipase